MDRFHKTRAWFINKSTFCTKAREILPRAAASSSFPLWLTPFSPGSTDTATRGENGSEQHPDVRRLLPVVEHLKDSTGVGADGTSGPNQNITERDMTPLPWAVTTLLSLGWNKTMNKQHSTHLLSLNGCWDQSWRQTSERTWSDGHGHVSSSHRGISTSSESCYEIRNVLKFLWEQKHRKVRDDSKDGTSI